MRKILCLALPIIIFIGLLLFSHDNTRQTEDTSNSPVLDEIAESDRIIFAPAKIMLIEKGVSFDPDILLSAKWRERLDPSFNDSYEMQGTLRTESELEGVQIADTVVLPEKVELTGDLVIIASCVQE
jgi:hypothetical protein